MAIIELKDLSVSYGTKKALDGLSLEIEQNKITSIIGPSGCGKTTLLHCINGMIKETHQATLDGNIYLNGTDIEKIPSDELKRRVGLVLQTPAPFPFSIFKNMTYAPKYYGIKDKKQLEAIAVEKLKMAGLYEEVKDDLQKNAKKLSGGQQQRLCIARALTANPDILLLDEPCSALDVQSTHVIEEMLLDLKKNYTILLVTHNIQQASRISDNTIFLYNGRLTEYRNTKEMFESPKEPETKAFLSGVFG